MTDREFEKMLREEEKQKKQEKARQEEKRRAKELERKKAERKKKRAEMEAARSRRGYWQDGEEGVEKEKKEGGESGNEVISIVDTENDFAESAGISLLCSLLSSLITFGIVKCVKMVVI